jgi:hypothetical protein
VRDCDIAEAQSDLFGKAVIIAILIGAFVINLQLFGAFDIIEYRHFLTARS